MVPESVREDCEYCSEGEAKGVKPIAVVSSASGGKWSKKVFPSPVSIVSLEDGLARKGEGMFDLVSGFGMHEVTLISPEHDRHLASLSQKEMEELVLLCRDRIIALKADPRLRSITVYGNHGTASSTLIAHEHIQSIATPIIPRILADEIAQSYRYFQAKERCVYCDIHEDDVDKLRVVYSNEKFVVITPYASRFPYEMWIMPVFHSSHFEDIGGPDVSACAEALRGAFGALDRLLSNPPYSFVLHNAPTHEKGMAYYHWHLEIMPRLANIAGFEWGTGFHINAIFPEEAARLLRESLESA